MAKEAKDKSVKTTKKTVEATDKNAVKKHFQTPTETWWGKLIVWIIMFGMVGLIILSFILAILKGTA